MEASPERKKRSRAQAGVPVTESDSKRSNIQAGSSLNGTPALPSPTEQFSINCLYVGQGDCILITCPDGKKIMIDCGNKYGSLNETVEVDKNISELMIFQNAVRNFSSSNEIDYLIITHSDKDHHSLLKYLEFIKFKQVILGALDWWDLAYKPKIKLEAKNLAKTKIDMVEEINRLEERKNVNEYLSELKNKYRKSSVSTLEGIRCNEIVALAIRDNKDKTKNTKYINISNLGNGELLMKHEEKNNEIKNGNFLVNSDIKDRWSVKIIAAQVEYRSFSKKKEAIREKLVNDKSGYMNAASLVTLIEIGGKKALFTGDATGATFNYLLNDSPDDIKKLIGAEITKSSPSLGEPLPMATHSGSEFELIQIPHHGSSEKTSHLQIFIDTIKAKNFFCSVKFNESGYGLPKWEALSRWKHSTTIPDGTPPPKDHYFGYWINISQLGNSKRILSNVDSLKTREGFKLDKPSDILFLKNIIKQKEAENNGIFGKEMVEIDEYILVDLKSDSKRANSNNISSLYALSQLQFNQKSGAEFFVMQFTKKGIITNGSRAISNYFVAKIKETSQSGGAATISLEELSNEAFNKIDAFTYSLGTEGVSLSENNERLKDTSDVMGDE